MKRRLATMAVLLPLLVFFAFEVLSGGSAAFRALPLRAKFAYRVFLIRFLPVYDPLQLSDISWHGVEAANIAVEFLVGRRHGLPARDAIQIIEMVQERGCDLRASQAYRELRRIRDSGELDAGDAVYADLALRAIEGGFRVAPGAFDGRAGGPCEQKSASSRAAH